MTRKHLRLAVSLAFSIFLAIFMLGIVGCTSYKPGADLSYADLTGKDLAGKDLRVANLTGANLAGANLEEAVLRRADLRDANLRDANLSNADLTDADLTEAILAGANLEGARLVDADLTGAILSSSLRKSDFAGAVFKYANFVGADLSDMDLSNLNLEGARLAGANLHNSVLSGANLRRANLSRANLSGTDVSNTDLSGADLSEATLAGVDFSGANLSSATLEGVVDLSEGILAQAIRQQAILGETVMYDLFSGTCLGRAIPGANDLEPVSDGSDYVLLKESGIDYSNGDLERITRIGAIRYVICIERTTVILKSCGEYGIGGEWGGSGTNYNLERVDVQVKIVDIRHGEVIANEMFIGQDPEIDECPAHICFSYGGYTNACEGQIQHGDLIGNGVPREQIHEFARNSVYAFEAQASQAATGPSPWSLYRSDAFDTEETEWPTGPFESGPLSGRRLISSGSYVWDVASSQAGGTFSVLNTIPVAEFDLAVEVTSLHGSQAHKQGLVFGAAGPADLQLFLLNGNGQYEILQLQNGQWRHLVEPSSSSAIKAGEANRLAIHSEGGTLNFYINDTHLVELNGSELQEEGKVGVFLELAQANDVVVLAFDNFELRTPHANQQLLLESAQQMAQSGEIEEAQLVYAAIVDADTAFEIPAASWNHLCWFSSLWGQPVMTACDDAVQLASGSSLRQAAVYQDSRGVARALTGDYSGAIEDFEAYVTRFRQDSSHQDDVAQREAWIAALEQGENPFSESTLKALRGN